LPVIAKLYNVLKKNMEKLKNTSAEFKLQKYRILDKLFEIFKFVSESKDSKSSKSICDTEELMKTILVKYISQNILNFTFFISILKYKSMITTSTAFLRKC